MNRDADVPTMEAPQRVAIGILGPCFVGFILEIFLSGICFVTFLDYVKGGNLSRDVLFVKIVTISVFVLNSAIAFCCAVIIFRFGTTQNRTVDELWYIDPLNCMQPVLIGVVAFLTQLYFYRRSFLLFENKICKAIFMTVVGLTMLLALGGSVGVTYFFFGTETNDLAQDWTITQSIWFYSSMVVDLLNTVTLCYLLQSKVLGFNLRTDGVLKKLMRLAVETAAYTTIVALAAAIVQGTANPNSYYVGDVSYVFWVPLPSLYCLSLLTTLGSRDRLAKDMTAPATVKGPTYAAESNTPQQRCRSPGEMAARPISGVSCIGTILEDVKEESSDYDDSEKLEWRSSTIGKRLSEIAQTTGNHGCVEV